MGQFGFQAGGGGAVFAEILHTPRPHRDHALQRRVGPQTLGLMDRQCRGVVDQEASVLDAEQRKESLLQQNLKKIAYELLLEASKAFLVFNHQWVKHFKII